MNLNSITTTCQSECKNKMYGYQRPWYANSFHWFNGRIIIGNKVAIISNIFNLILFIYTGSLIFYTYLLLWDNGYKLWLIATTFVYFIFAVNLFLGAYTDPGVLLRPKEYLSLKQAEFLKRDKVIKSYLSELQEKSRQERDSIENQLHSEGATEEQIKLRLSRYDNLVKVNCSYDVSARKYVFDQREKERREAMVQENLEPHIFTTRFCKTWFIWRPSGVSHCMHWNHWVKGYDHHCSVFNGWVGERNIRNFVYILLSASILSLLITYLIYSYYSYWINNLIDKQHYDLFIQK